MDSDDLLFLTCQVGGKFTFFIMLPLCCFSRDALRCQQPLKLELGTLAQAVNPNFVRPKRYLKADRFRPRLPNDVKRKKRKIDRGLGFFSTWPILLREKRQPLSARCSFASSTVWSEGSSLICQAIGGILLSSRFVCRFPLTQKTLQLALLNFVGKDLSVQKNSELKIGFYFLYKVF